MLLSLLYLLILEVNAKDLVLYHPRVEKPIRYETPAEDLREYEKPCPTTPGLVISKKDRVRLNRILDSYKRPKLDPNLY